MKQLLIFGILCISFSACVKEEGEIKSTKIIDPLDIQARLFYGETPFEIYKSNNSLLSRIYGKKYQGGIIFYLDILTEKGMVVNNYSANNKKWACNVDVKGTSFDFGTGKSNTEKIKKICQNSNSAIDYCTNLSTNNYSDWYLPSINELKVIKKNSNFNLSGYFWSSTQNNNYFAYVFNYRSGTDVLTKKDYLAYVMAIRNF